MKNSILPKVQKEYKELTELLIRSEITFSCMESCTSGIVSSLITDTPGASAVFRGGICTYSNVAKIKSGVSDATLKQYGVYSRETASEMAAAIRKLLDTDLAAGITGSLCTPDPLNHGSIPGEVFLAVCSKGKETVRVLKVSPHLSRFEAKLQVASELCSMIMDEVFRLKAGKNEDHCTFLL